jgi:methionyl-tRNA formyltransferase
MAKKVLFIGSKPLGLHCLEEVFRLAPESLIGIITIDDRDDGRNVFGEFGSFAAKAGIELYVAKNRKDSENAIRRFGPDLCLVNGWYWIIGDDALQSVPGGFLGMHNSLLPKYRGGSPLVWTIINGEDRAGLSLFSFTSGMDEGDIWARDSVSIESEDYISDILYKLEEKAIIMLRENYLNILNDSIIPTPQDTCEVTYCCMRIPEDGLINWHGSAKQIYNFIRAQSDPYPGAFTFLDGKKLIIWRAHQVDITYYGTPGQVAKVTPDGTFIICGNNKPLILETLELENGKEQAGKIIKSVKTRLGNK